MISKQEFIQLPKKLSGMSDRSRVWIYQADRILTDEELRVVHPNLQSFASSWVSHHRQLKAAAQILYGCFVIVALDEDASHEASGCSIDTMVKNIQALGKHIGVDFMDRKTFYFMREGKAVPVLMDDLSGQYEAGSITDDTLFFNSLVSTKEELTTSWLIPLCKSWHFRFV